MSDSGGNPTPNGSSVDPMQRLASFKTPRDLSLGAAKPIKKVFTPNLKVSRNKNKSGPNLPVVTRDKGPDKGRKDRKNDRNKNAKNGPNIIKSSGVFSDGMAASERHVTRQSYGRDVDAAPTLQKPTIRVKDVWKIDKELEERNIKKVYKSSGLSDDEDQHGKENVFENDAPVRLPLVDGGWMNSVPKVLFGKELVRQEPRDDVDGNMTSSPVLCVKQEPDDHIDMVDILKTKEPTLIMLQFPDSLPGRGRSGDDTGPRRRGNNDTATSSEQTEETPVDDRCRLSQLDEGRIGKLLVHRSGRVRLALGDTVFEVCPGTQPMWRQEVVSVGVDDDSRSASLISLGALPHKLSLQPHWETMMADIAL